MFNKQTKETIKVPSKESEVSNGGIMNTLKQKAGQILCLLFFVAIISGCVTDRRDARYSSSVVDYL
jgi:hypothetical protein